MTDSSTPQAGARIYRVESELNIYVAAQMRDQLLEQLNGVDELELDLSAVGEMDSAGFQLLVMLREEAGRQGKTLSLSGHSQAVLDVFRLFNAEAYFGDPLLLPTEGGLQ